MPAPRHEVVGELEQPLSDTCQAVPVLRSLGSACVVTALCALGFGFRSEGHALRTGDAVGTLVWWKQGGPLLVTGVDGRALRRLRVDSREAAVSLSSNGSRIAVSDSHVRLVDLRTGKTRQLIAGSDIDGGLGTARFSSNGRYLAVAYDQSSCFDQRPRAGILLVDLVTGTRTKRPVWARARPWRHGDFTRFVFVEHLTNNGEVLFRETRYSWGDCRYQDLVDERIWSTPRGAADPHLLVRETELGDVARSPDETRLAFTVGSGDECELRVADADGKRPRFVASRAYVSLGCSRGLRGLSLLWSPDGRRLYYGDGSAVYAWDAASSTSSLLLRPAGSPPATCMSSQRCIQHLLHDSSRDGAWLLLEQSDPYDYKAVPKVLLVDVARRTNRVLHAPRGGYELVAAQLS